MSAKNGKDPAKKPGDKPKRVPTLKRQPNGGMLWAGPAANPVAGTGRPPNALRGSLREILDEGLPFLREFAVGAGEDARPSDQRMAIGVAGRIGMGEKVGKGLVDELWAAVEATVDADALPAVRREWNRIVGRRLIEAVVTT